MRVVIIGSGVAGCLAASYFKNEDVTVIEKDSEINFLKNHQAIFRMKEDKAALILGKRVEQIDIEKNYVHENKIYTEPNILLKNSYSLKVSGNLEKRSIFKKNDGMRYQFIDDEFNLNCELKTSVGITRIESGKIFYNEGAAFINYDLCISTIPFPAFLDIVSEKIKFDFKFQTMKINILQSELFYKENKNVFQTIYFSGSETPIYRITLQGKKVICESKFCKHSELLDHFSKAIKFFGLEFSDFIDHQITENKTGKIGEIDENLRKGILSKLTDKYGVYFLGRTSIWKPGVMIDDLVYDIEKINKIYKISKERRQYESKIDKLY